MAGFFLWGKVVLVVFWGNPPGWVLVELFGLDISGNLTFCKSQVAVLRCRSSVQTWHKARGSPRFMGSSKCVHGSQTCSSEPRSEWRLATRGELSFSFQQTN